jgi:hypothetical protein
MWSRVKGQYCTTAYIISRKGASFLVDTFSETMLQSDHMLQRLQEREHSYGYFPWLAIPQVIPSDIIRINKIKNDFNNETCIRKTDRYLEDHIIRLAKLRPEDINTYVD